MLTEAADSFQDRGERLLAAFRDAVLLPNTARRSFLEEIGAEDPDLRAEVEALLAADDATTGDRFLESPARTDVLDLDDHTEDEATGRQIGPYMIVRLLGRGGMGSVYLAHRSDVDKQVAVKLLDTPFASTDASRRFLLERTVLARLDHPNIARLLDAGIFPPSTPYFAMEYVDGEPITEYAEHAGLATKLRIFEAICAAVAYAHQHLVVHRDLKPSNILVGRTGAVKLVDFGIAKLLEEDHELTGTGHRLMTPESAAPEQVRGEPITPATDVYALGLLLFQLLTGTRPYSLRGLTPSRAERMVCDWTPPRPSTLEPRAAGDLDAICFRALEKDPARRYPTASELLADVQRHLSNRPIEARPPTLVYVARKFVARHWIAAGTATLSTLLLLGGSAAIVWQATRAERERDRAELARVESDAVADFLIGLFEARDPAQGRGADPTAQDLLTRGEARAEQLTGQPLVQARMLDTIGRVYASLGQFDRAEPLARRALALRRHHLPGDHADTATSLHNLASLYQSKGRYAEAEPLFLAALAMRRQVLGPEHPDVAETLSLYGVLIIRLHRDDRKAEQLLQEAVQIRRRAHGPADARVASALNTLAAVSDFRDDYDTTERLLREALAIQRQQLGDSHPDSIATLSNLGTTLVFKRSFDAAEATTRETLRLQRQVYGPAHPSVGLTLNNLAAVFERSGQTARADATYREALQIAEPALGTKHPRVALLWSNRARVRAKLGDPREAERLNRRALAVYRATFGPDHAQVKKVERQLQELLRPPPTP
jgi:eukaryotic-like serine/threonine-protein kinase